MNRFSNQAVFTLMFCASLLCSPAFGQSQSDDYDDTIDPPVRFVNDAPTASDENLSPAPIKAPAPAINFNPLGEMRPAVIPWHVIRDMPGRNQSFDVYKKVFIKRIAQPASISDSTIAKVIEPARFSPRQFSPRDPNRPPPSFRENYLSVYLDQKHRSLRGALAWKRHEGILNDIHDQFGVPPNVLMALRCAETDCGRFFGERGVVEAALTRAYLGRREKLFLEAAIHALQLMDNGDLELDAPSSWAACVGQYQFLPFNFFRAGVDADGGGINLFKSFADASYSAANLLVDKGWQTDKHIAFSLSKPGTDGLNRSYAGPYNARPLGEWIDMGIEFDGEIPDDAMDEIVTMRNLAWRGDEEPYWLAFGENGNVIHRWNHSWPYVTVVHELSQEIEQIKVKRDLARPVTSADLQVNAVTSIKDRVAGFQPH